MSSPRALTIGSFVAVNRVSSDFRHVPRLIGWDDAPPSRSQMQDAISEDGSEDDAAASTDKRVISIDGIVDQPSHAAAITVRDALRDLTARSIYRVTVDDGVNQLWVDARVTQGAVFEWVNNVCFKYTIQLTAPYPHRRGVTAVTTTIAASASPSLTNAGTVAAEVEITTTSTGTVKLTAGGLTIETSSVPSGTVLTSGPGFTNAKHSVVGPSGQDLFGSLVPGFQWPAVAPGSAAWSNTGTANVSVKRYPTYP